MVSIINGSTDETIYGISITRYITKIKPVFFAHKRLIILDILSIMQNRYTGDVGDLGELGVLQWFGHTGFPTGVKKPGGRMNSI